MNRESPARALLVVASTALVCSILVTVTAVSLQPIQRAYGDLERIRFIVAVSGPPVPVASMSDLEVITAYQALEPRVVDLERDRFDMAYDPRLLASQAGEASAAVAIPAQQDLAALGQRPRHVTVYLVREAAQLRRLILPVYGAGMWSTIHGFLALEADLNTIADITFHEHGETPGIGDRIQRPDWLARWRGRRLFDEQGELRFRIVRGEVDPASPGAAFAVDGLAGATVTTDGVTNLIRYWLGPHGFGPLLRTRSEQEWGP